MNEIFRSDEKLYRAVYPPEIAALYWKRDGSISHMAFFDPKGLSVDRGDYRSDDEVVSDMERRLSGSIVMWYVRTCNEIGAVPRYLPSRHNPYHTEVHGNYDHVALSRQQCFMLAKKVTVIKSSL